MDKQEIEIELAKIEMERDRLNLEKIDHLRWCLESYELEPNQVLASEPKLKSTFTGKERVYLKSKLLRLTEKIK